MNPHTFNLPHPTSASDKQNQLSVGIAYYIRKILRQNLDQLTFIVATGAGIKADPLNDLNVVIRSLYLEDEEIHATIQQLEHLALLHQSINVQGASYRQETKKIEQQIFWLLGFRFRDPSHQGKILLIDDILNNLSVLSAALKKQDYEVFSAINGALGLTKAHELKPDLILLDIMMPGMDGYEVCRRLKADPQTCDIPVIFISAISDVLDKVKAFGVGGADYILKPFRIEEVLARVEHQMNIQSLKKRLEEQNERLQQEIQDHKKTELLYRSIFENALYGIFQTTPDGRYLRANPALARIYGYASPEELITTINNIAEQVYVQPERRHEFIAQIQQHGTVMDFDSQVYCKDGRVIWISESARTVKNTDGAILFYEGTVKAITGK